MILGFDALLPTLQNSMLLEKVEQALRNAKHEGAADILSRLHKDIGVQCDPEFDRDKPASGPQTAALYEGYHPVTTTRLNEVLRSSHALLPEGRVKSEFTSALESMLVKQTSPAPKMRAANFKR